MFNNNRFVKNKYSAYSCYNTYRGMIFIYKTLVSQAPGKELAPKQLFTASFR